ncbi:MAG: hypothetical protein JSW43_13220 [Gemmatimonadota bacterium]|nr:MAG: hypothetical protein JSW43_13220 [Gemmatimonadota bacterium]
MAAIRFRRAEAAALCALAGVALAAGEPPLRDAPVVWHENDRQDIPAPRPRDPNKVRSSVEATLFRPLGRIFHPGRIVRGFGSIFGGDHVPPAANINALDETPNSSWFTNRIGLFPLRPEQAARGPLTGPGPDTSGTWTVVDAKTEGVTPGFTVEDARGDRYLIKFDPPGYLGMTVAAGVISGRLFHAAGYNVPEDVAVTFRRDRVRVGDGVVFTTREGDERSLTTGDLDSILGSVERLADGRWLALASKFLGGEWMGPFDWQGRRKDDLNDRIDHQNRREIRGLRIFSAWLCHMDTKQGNTLDMYVEEDGRRFVRHYLIDFASTLGVGALGPFPMGCFEYSFDVAANLGRAITLGAREDNWRKLERPEGLDEIGYFESEYFNPKAFKPLEPNSAFANLTDRDGYWAAKIISAFSDAHLDAVVAEGRYRHPEAARYVRRMLSERRDVIARFFFDRVPPLDFFAYDRGVLHFHDLGVERGVYRADSTRYRVRAAAVTATRTRAARSPWIALEETRLDVTTAGDAVTSVPWESHPFWAFELQVHRGEAWSPSVTAYVARVSGRVVALDR